MKKNICRHHLLIILLGLMASFNRVAYTTEAEAMDITPHTTEDIKLQLNESYSREIDSEDMNFEDLYLIQLTKSSFLAEVLGEVNLVGKLLFKSGNHISIGLDRFNSKDILLDDIEKVFTKDTIRTTIAAHPQ